MVKVVLKDMLYVESLKDYVKIIATDSQLITKTTIPAIEAMLPAAGFLRILRSFIIATHKLTAYDNTHVQLGSVELPIGKMYQHKVFKKLQPLF
jgi:DNA-binding LytR/AlgR family response regulator